jgi:hypothetical protein
MIARVIRLPSTPEGRELLREAARTIGGWGQPGGAELEDFDWDGSAEFDREMGLPHPPRQRRAPLDRGAP